MAMSRLLLLAALLSVACAQAQLPGAGSRLREWHNASGETIKGRMLGSDAQSVSIKLESTGEPSLVPLAGLSEADRAFVAETGWKLPRPWSKWPSDIKVEPGAAEVSLVSSGNGKHVYHTRHFEFVSGAALGQAPLKDIARIFESTYELMQASPWGVLATPRENRFRAEFHTSREKYIAAGGPKESSGVYLSDRKVLMVPFPTLGLVPGTNGWQRSKGYSTETLVHELTHMLMDEALPAMPMWLTEGAAEYMELMPVKGGVHSPAPHPAAVQKHHKQRPAFDLAKAFVMNRETWESQDRDKEARGAQRNADIAPRRDGHHSAHQLYEAGLLLTYYFIHLDGKGDAARLQRFIAACAKNSGRLDHYATRAEEYNTAFEAFVKRPDVKHLGGDQYEYPEELSPPLPPPWPFEGEPEDLASQDLELLLDGRSVKELMAEANAALAKAGLPPIPPAAEPKKR
jgi:hypothetical protein